MAQSDGQGNGSSATTTDEQSLGELFKHLSAEGSRLARLEIELAKAEVAQRGRQIGIGAGAFGGAAVIGFCALGALTAAAILGLAEAVDGWLAALVVGALLAGIATIAALIGKDRVDAGTPPAPERAIASTRHDIEAAKRGVKEARG